tara:strand:- start:12567 stop:12827 length:261 start_codon:yes stop_codon:yes gene_type:complete
MTKGFNSRRDFLKILFLTSVIIVSRNIFKEQILLSFFKNKKNFIKEINKKRIFYLKNNLKEDIKNDLNNNRTIWLGKKLYTYAELF